MKDWQKERQEHLQNIPESENPLDILGWKIRHARLCIEMTQKDMAFELGLSDKAISSYEIKRVIPTLEGLIKIAKLTGREVSWFLKCDVQSPTPQDLIDKIHVLKAKLDKVENQLKDVYK